MSNIGIANKLLLENRILSHIFFIVIGSIVGLISINHYISIFAFLLISSIVLIHIFLKNPLLLFAIILPIEVIGPVPFVFTKILKLLLIILLIIYFLAIRKRNSTVVSHRKPYYQTFILLFLLVGTFSSLLNSGIISSFSKVVQYFLVFSLYFVLSKNKTDKNLIIKTIDYLIYGAVISSIVGLLQHYTSYTWLWPDAVLNSVTGASRITAFFNNTNGFSGYLAIIVPFAVMKLFINDSLTFKKLSVNLIIISIIMFAIFVSESTGSFLSALVSILILSIGRLIKLRKLIITLIPLFIIFLILFTNPMNNSLSNLIIQILNKENRFVLWQGALDIIKDNPIFGIGFYSFPQKLMEYGIQNPWGSAWPHPHNIVLDILVTTGILGLFVFILFLSKMIKKIWSLNSINTKCGLSFHLNLTIIASMFGSLFHDLLDGGFLLGTSSAATLLWMLIGLVESNNNE